MGPRIRPHRPKTNICSVFANFIFVMHWPGFGANFGILVTNAASVPTSDRVREYHCYW